MQTVQFTVLGPVRIAAADRALPLAGPLRRGLLGLLLVHANRLVTMPEIIEALWGGAQPATAAAQVRAGISVIRRTLRDAGGEAAAAMLSSSSGGYLLRPEPGALDLDRFEQDIWLARQALAGRRLAQAYGLLHDAVDLWLGEPLADAAGAYLAGTRARLEEERLAAQEDLIDVGLALGRHAELVPQLVDLVTAYPLRQRPHGQLMLALYRTGRAPEALTVYRQLRRRLSEELGLAPTQELDRLHLACLRGDVGLEATALRPPPAEVTLGVPPAQLPRAIGDFTGREPLVGMLVGLLGIGGDQAPLVVSIIGKPGVGKTALAVQVGHRMRDRFPDGQLYARLGGRGGQPAEPVEVLAGFLRGLGVADSAIPASLDERAALYRSLLAERRVLVVLDDATDEAQVRPLLPGQPPSAVVLTGRRRLVGLEDSTVVALGLLEPKETLDLLGRITGAGRLSAEPAAAATIGEQCGHLPLAVRICGARLAAGPDVPLADFARLLAEEQRRLSELAAGDLDVRSSFAMSYRALPEPHRRAFRLLGLPAVPDFAAWLAAALLDGRLNGAPGGHQPEILQRLVDDQLVDVVGRDAAGQLRYRLHDLLRLYAGERLHAEDPPEAATEALRRAAAAAATMAERHSSDNPAGARVAWIGAERTVLVTLVEQAFQHGCADLGWRLTAALDGLFEASAHFEDWRHTRSLALAAAVAAGDRRQQALAHSRLATALWLTDRWPQAHEHLRQCLPIFRELGDTAEEARALRTLGRIQHEQGQWDEAIASLSASSVIFQRLGDRREVACTLRDLGMRHRFRNNTAAALDCLDRSMKLYQVAGEPLEAAWTRIQLGCSHRDAGSLTRAEDLLARSLSDMRTFAEPSGQVQALFQLAVTYRRQGRLAEAVCHLQTSLEGARRLGHRLGEGMVLLNLAEIHTEQVDFPAADRCARRSLAIFAGLDSAYWQGRAHATLGRLLARTGRPAAARDSWRQALTLFEPLGAPEAEEIAGLMQAATTS